MFVHGESSDDDRQLSFLSRKGKTSHETFRVSKRESTYRFQVSRNDSVL